MKDKLVEIGKDSTWYLVATVMTAFLGFLSIPIFTRIFTPSQYGIYSLVATSIALGSSLFFTWIMGATIRFYPEYEKKG